MTNYRVLFKSGDKWEEIDGVWLGANSKAAITAALTKFNFGADPSGEFVAVPARSWDPVKVEAKQAFSFS